MRARKQTQAIDHETTRFYLRFTKPYLRQTIYLLLLRPTFTICAYIGNIYIVSLALDKLTKGVQNLTFWHDFGPLIIALIIMEIIRAITEQLSLNIIWKVQVATTNDIAEYVYKNLMYRDATFHANHFTGSLVSQTNKFISAYERLHDTLYWNVYSLFINIIATFALLFIKLPSYAFMLLILVAGYSWYAYFANKRAHGLNSARASAETKNTGQLADSITNVLTVKSYARETHEINRYHKGIELIKSANEALRTYTIKKDFKLSAVVSLAGILALVMSVLAVTHGYATVGTIALATALTRDTLMRLREFNSNVMRNIARSYGDAEEMTKILLTDTTINDPSLPFDFAPKEGEVQFSNVTFWYPEKSATDSLFNGLNLNISAGQKVGLVGPSGGGKTTITRLLQRFLDIQDGSITIDGQDIAKVRQADLREYISYVPQEPLLFHRSIAENMRYGKPNATLKEIIDAATKAHAHEFIEKLQNGYDTLVGERGVKLSGGQRQRIAIARAMLKNAPLLVLDEATSALDSEAEVLIQDALWKLMQNKTTLVIAHRLSTIQKMDRIVVLQNGIIEEDGTHLQLLKNRRGLYSKLWAHQSGGFLKD